MVYAPAPNQIFRRVFDDPAEALRVIPFGGFYAPSTFDAIVATYPSAISEVYTYKDGGTGGTTVMTITVTYTDSTKEFIDTVVRT